MADAIYRGVPYDTDQPKQQYEAWWKRIHHDASRNLCYRGKCYRPCRTSGNYSRSNPDERTIY